MHIFGVRTAIYPYFSRNVEYLPEPCEGYAQGARHGRFLDAPSTPFEAQKLTEDDWWRGENTADEFDIIAGVTALEEPALILARNREHFDGSGYPQDLRAEEVAGRPLQPAV